MGLGEIFALSCAMTWALAIILFRAAGGGLGAFELNFIKNSIGLGLMIPTALLVAGWRPPAYAPGEWLIVLLSGSLGIALADTWYLRALQILGASRTGIVAGLYSPFVVVLSVVFLGERLLFWQYGGFLLVLAGIALVTRRQRDEALAPREIYRGAAWAVGAVLLMAVGIVMVKGVLERHEFFWTTTFRLAGGLGGMLLFITARGQWRRLGRQLAAPQPWPLLITAAVLSTYISMLLWLAGYRYTLASIAAILNETAAAFITLFAWLALREPLGARKLAGLGLTLGGVLVLLAA